MYKSGKIYQRNQNCYVVGSFKVETKNGLKKVKTKVIPGILLKPPVGIIVEKHAWWNWRRFNCYGCFDGYDIYNSSAEFIVSMKMIIIIIDNLTSRKFFYQVEKPSFAIINAWWTMKIIPEKTEDGANFISWKAFILRRKEMFYLPRMCLILRKDPQTQSDLLSKEKEMKKFWWDFHGIELLAKNFLWGICETYKYIVTQLPPIFSEKFWGDKVKEHVRNAEQFIHRRLNRY